MTIANQIKTAIAQSQSQDERVSLTITTRDISEAIAEINAVVDCDVDYAEENDGSYDVWGDDWRLCVTINGHEVGEAVEAADVCCPEQVADMCFIAVKEGRDWREVLAECKANDADERKALGFDASLVGKNSSFSPQRRRRKKGTRIR